LNGNNKRPLGLDMPGVWGDQDGTQRRRKRKVFGGGILTLSGNLAERNTGGPESLGRKELMAQNEWG